VVTNVLVFRVLRMIKYLAKILERIMFLLEKRKLMIEFRLRKQSLFWGSSIKIE